MGGPLLNDDDVFELRCRATAQDQEIANTYYCRIKEGPEHVPGTDFADTDAFVDAWQGWFAGNVLPLINSSYKARRYEIRRISGSELVFPPGENQDGRWKWVYDWFDFKAAGVADVGQVQGPSLPTYCAVSITTRAAPGWGISVGGKRFGPVQEADTDDAIAGNYLVQAALTAWQSVAETFTGQVGINGATTKYFFYFCHASAKRRFDEPLAHDYWCPRILNGDCSPVISSQISRKQGRPTN